MTTRHEVSWEMLPLLATAVSSVDELLLHDASDGVEKRTTVAAVLAGVSSATGRSWTVGSTAPASPNVGDAWADTSRSEIAWRLWDGSTWQVIGPSVLDGATIVAAINNQFGNINWQQGRNPRGVVSITVSDGTATVTHEDGSTSTFSVTSDDETARTLARNAQAAADAARGIADTNATAIAGIPADIAAALDMTDLQISTGGEFASALGSQATADSPLLLYIAANIDQTVSGTRYQYQAPTILWVPPRSGDVNVLFSRAQIIGIANAIPGSSVEQRVLLDEAVSATTVGKLVIEQGQSAFVTQEITHPDRPATFDAEAFTNSAYLGIINYEPQASSRSEGDWRIVPTSWHVRRVASFSSTFGGNYLAWVDATFAAVGITSYLGEYATEAEAASHVTANGQYYIDTAVPQLMVTSNYVAGSTGQRTEYKRHDLATADAVNDLARRAIHNSLKDINSYLGDKYDTAPFRVYQSNGVPGILNVADLDGDYTLAFKHPEALVENDSNLDTPEKRARIDELRIFIFNGGIGTVVHRIAPWTYSDASQTIDFNISAAEETGAASRITGDEVIFRVVAYADNGAVGNALTSSMPINPAFEPPATGGGGGGSTEQRVLVDVPASAQTIDKIIVEDSQLYSTITQVVHEATPQSVTFENIRFDLGYFSDESALDANFYNVGRFYYNFARYTPRVVAYITGNSGPKHWIDGVASDLVANVTGDVGHYPSDDAASPNIQAVGNVYYNERQRRYRRATAVTPGSGAVTVEARLRQANDRDLARIDNDFNTVRINRLEFVATPSPAFIDVDNPPPLIEVNVVAETNKWVANTLRITVLGQITNITYNPESKSHTVSIPFTPQMQANARLATTGNSPDYKTRLDAEILQDNVTLASTRFFMVIRDGAIGNLITRTADLRESGTPSWVTASGTGVGIAISRTVVTDLSTLTFSPMATVPSAASAGDEVYYYIAIPTGSNLNDWRLSLAGIAFDVAGSSWGAAVGTVGSNSVYSRAYGVGDGSGGIQSATARGATITLQNHDTHTTAFSGELEGRALSQVQSIAGGDSGPGALTEVQQIGLVKFTPEVPTFQWAALTDLNRTWQVLVDGPELVTGDVWYQRRAGAGEIGSRVKWTSTTNSIAFPFTDTSTLAGIVNSLRFPLELWFYDAATGGNLIEIVRVMVGLSHVDSGFVINSAANILYDVDSSSPGVRSTGVLTLMHDATLQLMGGQDGSTALLQITQATRPQGGWVLTLHSSIQRYNNIDAPVLSTENGAVDLLQFQRLGSVWYYIGRLDNRSTGGGGTTFTPSKANLYSAVKEIFHPATNAGVTADDANNELDVAAGGTGGLNQAQVDARVLALRSLVTQSATAVAQDRFFFTDENQSGDPLRYITFNNLVAGMTGTLPTWVTDPNVDIPDSKLDVVLSSDSVIINDPDGTVVPDATNRNRLRYHNRQFYYNRATHYTDPTVTYRNLAATDLPAGYTVLGPGVYQVTPSLSGVANNAVWYSIPAGGWRRKITFGGMANVAFWTPNFTFRGLFEDESTADGHVGAVGEVVIFGGQARVVSAYTARTPDAFEWSPLQYQIDADNLNAADDAQKKAFRAAIGAAAVFVGTTLPAATAINNGDWVIFASDVSSGLVWRDFAGNALTSAEAGDLGVFVGGRTWQRLGNIIQGPAKIRTQALTSAAAITWNVASGHTATLTLGVNATLQISGGADGDLAFLKVKQDATGSRTLALHASILRFKDTAAPTLSTTANSVDLLMFVNDGGTWNFVGHR